MNRDQKLIAEAYQQLIESNMLHSFKDWVKWIMTVQKGQAITVIGLPAYKAHNLDQPGDIVGNFDNVDGPLKEEDLLAKKPITAYVEYEDVNGNRQSGHVSIYNIRKIGSRGPRYNK